jgi:hypothetical protein
MALQHLGKMKRLRSLALRHTAGNSFSHAAAISASCLPPLLERCELYGDLTLETAAWLDEEAVAAALGLDGAEVAAGLAEGVAAEVAAVLPAAAAVLAAAPTAVAAAAPPAPPETETETEPEPEPEPAEPEPAPEPEPEPEPAEPAAPPPATTEAPTQAAAAAAAAAGAAGTGAEAAAPAPASLPSGSSSSRRPAAPLRLAALRVLRLSGVTIAAPAVLLPASQLQHLAIFGSPGAYPTGAQQLVQQHADLTFLEVRCASGPPGEGGGRGGNGGRAPLCSRCEAAALAQPNTCFVRCWPRSSPCCAGSDAAAVS